MRAALFLAVLFVNMAILRSEECRCAAPYGHPQDMFCSSDYVMHGLVVAGPNEENLVIPHQGDPAKPWVRPVLVYTVELRAVFKGSEAIKATTGLAHSNKTLIIPSEVRIYTDKNACAAALQLGVEYLLAGYSDKERLEVFSCNWIQRWASLTRSQRIAVRHYYGKHCACRSSLCSLLDPLGGVINFECGAKHLYCALRRDGATCRWRSVGRWYRTCVEGASVQSWHFL